MSSLPLSKQRIRGAMPKKVLPVAQVVFCEDARLEAAGTITLVGTFWNYAGIAGPTQPIAKLVAFSQFTFPVNFQGRDLRIRLMDGHAVRLEASISIPPPPEDLPTHVEQAVLLTVPLEMLAFVLTDGMVLRVEASCGSDWAFESHPLKVVNRNK